MGDEDNTIYFYSANGPYGCFSNFSRHTVFLKDKKWPTSEHYFQAQKFAGTPFEEQVRCTDGPGQSAKMGRNRSLPLRKDWEKVKEGIMKDALIAKFSQHADIKATLLSTANKTLVEHTTNDTYWADGGGPGCGKNRLGFLLMEVRDEMLAKENGTPLPTKTTPTTEAEKEQEETTTSGSSGEEQGSGEEGAEGAEGEEGLEPNRNRMYEVPASAEKKTLGAGKKKVRRGGVSKSRTKRSAFRDEDGSSKLEKTNETKGAVTVIGEGTVFSEKALPPQAKFVVHRHQMQRKYHPTEKDFEDEPEEEEEAPKTSPSKKNYLSEFVTPKMKGDEEPVNELVFVNNEARRTEMVGGDGTMTADECIAAAKSNLDLLAEVTDPEVAAAIKETCNNIKNNMSRYIEEFAEANNADQLLKMMEQFEKLQAAC